MNRRAIARQAWPVILANAAVPSTTSPGRIGKALGIFVALGLILVPATILGVAALALTSAGGLLAGDPARAVWLFIAYLAYFIVVIAIALAVSARVRSSRLALVILLTFWFANGLVASRAVSDLAASLHPTPSAVEFQKALERDLNDPDEMQRRFDKRKAALFEQYGVASLDALPVAFSGISLQEGEEHGNEVFDHHYGRLFAQYEKQNVVYQLGAMAAPMLAVRALSMGLAGTDFEQHRHFIAAAEDYRRGIQRVMNGDIAANQKKGEVYLAGRELWERVPDFEYDAPSTSWVLGHQQWSAIILGGWLVVSVAFMLRSARTASVD